MEYHASTRNSSFGPYYVIPMRSALVVLMGRDHAGMVVCDNRPKLQDQAYVQTVKKCTTASHVPRPTLLEVFAVGLDTAERYTLWASHEKEVSYPTVTTPTVTTPTGHHEALTGFVYQLLQHVPAGVIRKAVEDSKSCNTFDGSLYAYAKAISEIVSD